MPRGMGYSKDADDRANELKGRSQMMTAVKERPILMSGPMVRATLDGKKTQTRRPIKRVKWKPYDEGLNIQFSGLQAGYYCTNAPDSGWVLRSRRGDGCWEDRTKRLYCPYGKVGDRLWVKETWQHEDGSCNDHRCGQPTHIFHKATETYPESMRWRPSIFMFRWASRILLEITAIRVERVHEISLFDMRAEGISDPREIDCFGGGREKIMRLTFSNLWDSINKKRGHGWDKNDWVWVMEFRLVTGV